MIIIGCDYHPSFQQIAWVDTETGECDERRLRHSDGEAERFYRGLNGQRVGMEATGHARWFERLLTELKYELWVGDPAQIRARRSSTVLRFASFAVPLWGRGRAVKGRDERPAGDLEKS
jgi:transposase